MNRDDEIYDMASVASAQILNHHVSPDTCKSMQFQGILGVILAAMTIAVMEERRRLLTPSDN